MRDNANTGVYAHKASGNFSVVVRGSGIQRNGGYGLYNGDTSQVVKAEDNWWGSDSGPAPYGSGNGINYTTQCIESSCIIIPYVDVIPWVGMSSSQEAQLGRGGPLSILQAFVADPVNTANGNYATSTPTSRSRRVACRWISPARTTR